MVRTRRILSTLMMALALLAASTQAAAKDPGAIVSQPRVCWSRLTLHLGFAKLLGEPPSPHAGHIHRHIFEACPSNTSSP
jgi:hypothetical protein